MKDMGATPEQIEEATGVDIVHLLDDNSKSWHWFKRCQTQWNKTVFPTGEVRVDGLDYCAVDRVLRRAREAGKRLKKKVSDVVFSEICDYEIGALNQFNQR